LHSDIIGTLGTYIGVAIFIFIAAIIGVIKDDLNKKNRPPVTVNNSAQYEAKIRSKIKSNEEIEKEEQEIERIALACPNCGAPLDAIYIRCEYCEMSYKEAKDVQEKIKEDGV
jgi:predicted RNA-binding Zn-ribbon protein involved in translation (DUF1610 family)